MSTSASEALSSLPSRQMTVIVAEACGSELEFNGHLQSKDNGEGVGGEILGKVAWYQHQAGLRRTHTTLPACRVTVVVDHGRLCLLFDAKCQNPDGKISDPAKAAFIEDFRWKGLTTWTASAYTPDVKTVRDRILLFLPPECSDDGATERYSLSAASTITDPAKDDPKLNPVKLTFTIAAACIKAQADQAILQLSRGDKQVGTEGAPCNTIFGSSPGDWDTTLKDLIRVAELDRRSNILSADARRRLNEDVIDIDGGPAQEGYHLWECGNEEQSVGSPQERSDAREGVDGFMDDLGDTFDDLLWLLLLILLVAAAVVVIVAVTSGSLAVAAIAAAVAGSITAVSVVLAVVTIPETENHLWLINSTKYLNNQYLMSNGGRGYGSDQSDLKDWMLENMQDIMKSDFLEYNSRPYQRYSQVALLNLADFAEDDDVRTGARLVLEYQMAKYSVTSSEGRRIAPYRRKRASLPHINDGAFDFKGGADYMSALGLLYFGTSINLFPFEGSPYAASRSWPSSAIYAATSGYVPDEAIFSLALDRSGNPPVFQQLHHHGWEIASSGAAFTLTAGGLTTGMPKNSTIDLIDQLFVPDDLGVAVPTVLMLTGRPHVPPNFTSPEQLRPVEERRSSLDRFLRFEGRRPEADSTTTSYDFNLCVWDGFACGANLVIPKDLDDCKRPTPRLNWFFIRSDDSTCSAYSQGPRFWMVIYQEDQANSAIAPFGPVSNIGFLEIVDATDMSFGTFKSRVFERNPSSHPISLVPFPDAPYPPGPFCRGTYVSARGAGRRLGFDCDRVTKVDSVELDSPGDWPHAGSPPGAIGVAPIRSNGNGRIEVTSPATQRKVVLDFEVKDNPMLQIVTLP